MFSKFCKTENDYFYYFYSTLDTLMNDILIKDDGSEVQISKCPTGHGKIKSPMCCGSDMTCSIS